MTTHGDEAQAARDGVGGRLRDAIRKHAAGDAPGDDREAAAEAEHRRDDVGRRVELVADRAEQEHRRAGADGQDRENQRDAPGASAQHEQQLAPGIAHACGHRRAAKCGAAAPRTQRAATRRPARSPPARGRPPTTTAVCSINHRPMPPPAVWPNWLPDWNQPAARPRVGRRRVVRHQALGGERDEGRGHRRRERRAPRAAARSAARSGSTVMRDEARRHQRRRQSGTTSSGDSV